MFDDDLFSPQTLSSGKSVLGSTYFFFPIGEGVDGKIWRFYIKKVTDVTVKKLLLI